MTTFLHTTNTETQKEYFYIGGCRVSKAMFYSVGYDKNSFITKISGKFIRHYHCAKL